MLLKENPSAGHRFEATLDTHANPYRAGQFRTSKGIVCLGARVPFVSGETRADSDGDLSLVAEGAERQLDAARRYREALWGIWPCPTFTLLPITPGRLVEKQAGKDPFFATVFAGRGLPLPRRTDPAKPADRIRIAAAGRVEEAVPARCMGRSMKWGVP